MGTILRIIPHLGSIDKRMQKILVVSVLSYVCSDIISSQQTKEEIDMRKKHMRPIPYPNAAEPEYFIRKFVEGVQSALVCIVSTLSILLLVIL